MAWHREHGAAVAPLPMSSSLVLVRAARAITVGGVIGLSVLFWVVLVAGSINEEALGDDREAALLTRALLGAWLVLALVAMIGEPLRLAVERALLLRAAERDADLRRPAAPAAERRALAIGPHPLLRRVGGWCAAAAGTAAMLMALLFAPDDAYSPSARALSVAIPVAAALAGLAIAVPNGRRGASRRRWERRWSRASLRWQTSITPVARADRPGRRLRLALVGAPLAIGALVFLAGVWMRQPGRLAERRTWGPVGEAAIDVLVVVGGIALLVAGAAALLGAVVRLVVRARRDAATLGALDRGEEPALEHVDAIVLDGSPLERAAVALGALGWALVIVALTPVAILVLEDAEAAAPFGWSALLWLPALAALALALVLAARGVRAGHAARTRVLAAVVRDPVPWTRPHADYDRPDPWGRLL